MDKKFLWALCLIPAFLFSEIPSHIVVERKVTNQPPKAIEQAPAGPQEDIAITVGGDYHRSRLDSQDLGTYYGNIWGGNVAFSYGRDWGAYVGLKVNGGAGTLHGTEDGNRIGFTEMAFDEHAGFIATWGERLKAKLTPYLGFRYLWMKEDLDIFGYPIIHYTYHKLYVPVGFNFDLMISKCFSAGFNFEYQINLETYQHIDSLDGARWFLKKRNDWFVELPLTYHPFDFLSVTTKPYFRSVRTGPSTAITNTGLQLGLGNQSFTMWGIELDLAYTF